VAMVPLVAIEKLLRPYCFLLILLKGQSHGKYFCKSLYVAFDAPSRASATLIRTVLPSQLVPLFVKASLRPSSVSNSTYPNPLGRPSGPLTMRTLVHYKSRLVRTVHGRDLLILTLLGARKSSTSCSRTSKLRFPTNAVYGGAVGKGNS
jgi:hypothetical protein